MDNLFNNEDKAKNTADRGPMSEWNDVLQTEWYYFWLEAPLQSSRNAKKKKKKDINLVCSEKAKRCLTPANSIYNLSSHFGR